MGVQELRTGQLKSVFESFPCHLATVGLGQVILYLCALFSLVVNRDIMRVPSTQSHRNGLRIE